MTEARTPRQIKESLVEEAQRRHDRIILNNSHLGEEAPTHSTLSKRIISGTKSAFEPPLHVEGRKPVPGR